MEINSRKITWQNFQSKLIFLTATHSTNIILMRDMMRYVEW